MKLWIFLSFIAVFVFLLIFFTFTTQPSLSSCPDLLIRQGSVLALVWSHEPLSDINPLYFPHMQAYLYYLEKKRKQEKLCPILQIQEESVVDPQGRFRVKTAPKPTVAFRDSGDDNPPFNQTGIQGYDPIGLHVGQYTKLDVIHDSTNQTWVPY